MAGELASDHASYLRGRVGRSPTAGELYAAHFLGPQGSARLIEAVNASPGASAAAMFPDAAAANRSIFYREGRAATVNEVYANLTKTAGGGTVPDIAPPTNAPDTDQGFVQYATGRRLERIQQQQELVNLILRGPQDADSGFSFASGGGSSAQRMTSSMFSSEMLRVLSDASDGDKRRR
jgi:hypothetical protein